MRKQNNCLYLLFFSCLALICLSNCSKSILSIGPFEGGWTGDLYFGMSYGSDEGWIALTVSSDHAVEGYGELYYQMGMQYRKWYELKVDGKIKANGALECQCAWTCVLSFEEEITGTSDVRGYLNPSLNYGMGSIQVTDGILEWIVHRQK